MPLHDWTKVNSGLYHHFHQFWSTEICRALNRGPLPKTLSALVEQRSGFKEPDVVAVELNEPDEPWSGGGATAVLERPRTRITRKSDRDHYTDRANRIVIRHRLGRIVAFIEIVSPGNKESAPAIRQFVEKIAEALRQGIHVLVIDPLPPSPRDFNGIHKAIWDEIDVEDFELPASQNRIMASYEIEARGAYAAHIETVGVGDMLPSMPLFIAPGAHVLVPLETSYMSAWQDTPEAVQRLLLPKPTVKS